MSRKEDHDAMMNSFIPEKDHSILMLLSNGFQPDPRVHKEAGSLVEDGYKVTIICLDRECNLPAHETLDGIEIRRLRTGMVKPGQFRSVGKALAMFYMKAGILARSIHRTDQFNLVHCHDFDTVALGLILKRLWKIPVVYDMHDLYASFFTSEKLRRLVQKLDDRCYSAVDAMLIVNDEFRSLAHVENHKTTVVMNVPGSEGRCKSTATDGGLFYAGNLNVLRDMRYAMKTFEESGFPVELAGDGPLIEDYRAAGCGDTVKLLGRITPDDVYLKTRRCRAVLALYDTSYPNNRFASPNKLFDAMKFGKPAVVSDETVMADIVREYDCGVVVRYGDAEQLKEALSLLRDGEKYNRMCENAYRAHSEQFRWEIMADRLVGVYRDLLGSLR